MGCSKSNTLRKTQKKALKMKRFKNRIFVWCSYLFYHPPHGRLHPGYHHIYADHVLRACGAQEKKVKNLQNTPVEIGLSREITLSLLGCCSKSNTLRKTKKKSPEDEEVRKIKFLC